jgi:hypothetical protein
MRLTESAPEIERRKLLLLNRILASPQFVHAESLQRILRYLYEQATRGDNLPVKEYEIAVSAIGRPPSFDPKLDAIVRVSIASVRERLEAYFENDGGNERWRLEIPKGQYCLRFAEVHDSGGYSDAEVSHPALRRFWRPYLAGSYPNILVYTELLCFRDSQGNYFRNIYVNDSVEGCEEARRRFPGLPRDVYPAFHFVSGGEMQTVQLLTRAFYEMHCASQTKISRFISWADMQASNLVVIGSARTNPFISKLQSGEKLLIREDCIEDCETIKGHTAAYQGSRYLSGSLERVSEYALVTRRPAPAGGTFVTLISANHGRAMEGAAQFLVREDKVRDLLDVLVPGDQSAVPDHFQILLRVEMVDFDEEVVDTQYVTHKI